MSETLPWRVSYHNPFTICLMNFHILGWISNKGCRLFCFFSSKRQPKWSRRGLFEPGRPRSACEHVHSELTKFWGQVLLFDWHLSPNDIVWDTSHTHTHTVTFRAFCHTMIECSIFNPPSLSYFDTLAITIWHKPVDPILWQIWQHKLASVGLCHRGVNVVF